MLRNVVFVAPFPTEATMRFVRAASKLDDVRLLGVVHTPPQEHERGLYHDLVRVENPLETDAICEGITELQRRHGAPYRIVGMLEAMMVELAEVRERFGVEGTSVRTARRFREKAEMKDALRAAGLPVARHKLLASMADADEFAEEVGFPMVVKPPAGMGARATFRVPDRQTLRRAVEGMRASPDHPLLAEEMLRGREHSFETITVGGVPRATSFASYHPGCLEVLETPWIQWACVLPREVETPANERARAAGVAAIEALGLRDGMTHMEWFEKPDGTVAIGEIAQRPPGPQLCQMTGLVHDVDIYRAWCRAEIDGAFDAPWTRKYAAGTAFLRGVGRGRVARVTGVRETHEAIAPWLIEAKLPEIGTPKSDSYEGEGYVVVRHPTTAGVEALIKTIIETIRVQYA